MCQTHHCLWFSWCIAAKITFVYHGDNLYIRIIRTGVSIYTKGAWDLCVVWVARHKCVSMAVRKKYELHRGSTLPQILEIVIPLSKTYFKK